MSQQLQEKNKEQLNQLSIQELVDIVLTQQEIIVHAQPRNRKAENKQKPRQQDLIKTPVF